MGALKYTGKALSSNLKNLAKKLLGKKGEKQAEKYLKKNGYKILERNYRTPFGEIDIIASDHKVLTFIEVKTRSNTAFGSPKDAVDKRKQKHIIKSSLAYLQKLPDSADPEIRFDVVSILITDTDLKIELVKDAFTT